MLDCDTLYNFDSLVTEKVNLIARFEKINNIYVYNKPVVNTPVLATTYYTVTFDTGVVSKVAKNNKIPMPTEPKKDGYDFVGWYLDKELTKKFSFDTLVTEDLNLYAKFEKSKLVFTTVDKSFTKTFELNGSMMVEPLYDEKDIEDQKKSIVGWYTDPELTNDFNFDEEINESTTIYVDIKDWTDSSYFTRVDNTITAYSDEGPKDVVIPKYIDDVIITDLDDMSFDSKTLTSVSIPSSIKTIGDRTFAGNKIKKIILPDSVLSIGDLSFSSNSIEKIIISKSMKEIPLGAFGYNSIKNIIIPDNIEIINDLAFVKNNIETLSISKNIKFLGAGAFASNQLPDEEALIYKIVDGVENKKILSSYAGKNRDNIVIPNNVETIDYYAFFDTLITSIEFPESLEEIGKEAFVSTLLNDVVLPNNIKTIRYAAFRWSTIRTLIIPKSLEIMEAEAFHYTYLESVIMKGRTSDPFETDWLGKDDSIIKFEN